ncbi:DASH family cryptochrome [Marinilabilia rubra]|uniref:Cryptochrome DASH n=1 Tax=Marinilabilia rubra TaxID=2162893 RepID=A0A2U2B4C0_9BACT|nr:DASH family cryptochrome [Marinilabilia rubra]PWD97903.1 DASH family cryptochrome [Marinilabilia rubra]
MSQSPIIYWFRNDLRLHDNPALVTALETGHAVIPVFIFEDLWYNSDFYIGFPRTGDKRKQFLAESLLNLQRNLKERGSNLLILKGDTKEIIPKIAKHFNALKVVAQKEAAWEEISIERQVADKVQLDLIWGSMLYQPDQVDFPVEKSPFYYTKFKNKVLEHPFSPSPVSTPGKLFSPSGNSIPEGIETFNPDSLIVSEEPVLKGGESEGLNRMENYFTERGPQHYGETRNQFQGHNFSSKLGSWLANGTLSPRLFFSRLKEEQEEHPEKQENIQPLLEQLIWRDYFRFLFLRYGRKLFTVKGLRKTEPSMYDDMEAFEKWKNAKTEQPLIDALMNELNETGFMSNRGRMLVSFYLSKEMQVNWQWGAAWFENRLIDYDVYCNYGNWAYQSGRGTDSRVNRKFNLQTQLNKFDPKGTFVERWNPGHQNLQLEF